MRSTSDSVLTVKVSILKKEYRSENLFR